MWRTSIVLAAILIGAAAAYAEDGSGACAADVQRFCPEVKPGGGRLMVCLRQHAKELSPGCKDAFATMALNGAGTQSRARRWYRACKPDIATHCKSVPAGEGRIAQCLESHSDQLARACTSALEARRARATARSTTPRPTKAAAVTPAATP